MLALTLLMTSGGAAALAQPDESIGLMRVRSGEVSLREVIARARTESPTFNRLVRAINASDGIVYVESGRCGPGIRSCLMLSVTIAGPHRVLRIVVDTRRKDRNIAAALGHELSHAIEVLQDGKVTSGSAMYFFYKNNGYITKGIFETDSAIAAGDAVRAELNAQRDGDSVSSQILALSQPASSPP